MRRQQTALYASSMGRGTSTSNDLALPTPGVSGHVGQSTDSGYVDGVNAASPSGAPTVREIEPAGVTWVSDEQNGIFRWKGPAPAKLVFPERSVILLAGLPGVGKGYFANRVFQTAPYFEYDAYWAKAGGPDSAATDEDHLDESRRGQAWQLLLADAEQALNSDGQVVVDACGLWMFQQEKLLEFAKRTGSGLHMLMLTAPRGVCEAGQLARGERVRTSDDMDVYEERWDLMKKAVRRGRLNEQGFASVTVLDRPYADCVQQVAFEGDTRKPQRWQLPYRKR